MPQETPTFETFLDEQRFFARVLTTQYEALPMSDGLTAANAKIAVCETCEFRKRAICTKVVESFDANGNKVVTGGHLVLLAATKANEVQCPDGKW